jgi:pSer/pThr/pTyr-binding forkhead associated (FHA) protein
MSFLIGRNTKDNEVDIDLSEAEYSELVSRQHAVLNFAEGRWYIEDIGSSYGSGLKKVDEEKFKMDLERLYEINSGDTLYIANTKIMVK